MRPFLTATFFCVVCACGGTEEPTDVPLDFQKDTVTEDTITKDAFDKDAVISKDTLVDVDKDAFDFSKAHVTAVSRSGSNLSVTIKSPDKGCDQYANWWEVISEDGELIYRRILAHSHVDEQPFSRSGGPVDIDENTRVIVRAHMHPGGYGGVSMAGTLADGFSEAGPSASFPELANETPSCAF